MELSSCCPRIYKLTRLYQCCYEKYFRFLREFSACFELKFPHIHQIVKSLKIQEKPRMVKSFTFFPTKNLTALHIWPLSVFESISTNLSIGKFAIFSSVFSGISPVFVISGKSFDSWSDNSFLSMGFFFFYFWYHFYNICVFIKICKWSIRIVFYYVCICWRKSTINRGISQRKKGIKGIIK